MSSQNDGLRPIQITLDETNYFHWAQQMHWFLQGRKLWEHVTDENQEPLSDESDYATKRADWVADNSRIISWFSNTFLPKINQLFGSFQTAKEVWDYLAATNTVSDLSSQYQIDQELHRLRQAPGQSVQDYYSQMAILWEKQTHPPQCATCLIHYSSARDSKHLRQFLMGLVDDYENVRSSILNRSPTISLSAALAEIKSEETRKKTAASFSHNSTVLVASSRSFGNKWCDNHKWTNHTTRDCSWNRSSNYNSFGRQNQNFAWRNKNQRQYSNRPAAAVTDNMQSSTSLATNMSLNADELSIISQHRQSQMSKSGDASSSSTPSFSACSVTSGYPDEQGHWDRT